MKHLGFAVSTALFASACGTPAYTVPPTELRQAPSELRRMKVEVVEFLVGDKWKFYKGSSDRYKYYESVSGVSDASWCLASALEEHGFSVESERLGGPADLRVSVLFEYPMKDGGSTGLASNIHIFVADDANHLLVQRTVSREVNGTDLMAWTRRSLLDDRPNHLPFAAVALQDVVDAMEAALAAREPLP